MSEIIQKVDNQVIQQSFTPMEIITIFREQLRTPGKVILIEGVFTRNERSQNYGGYFYDTLRGEQDSYEITVKVPFAIRDDIKNGTLVRLGGTITKGLKNNSYIQLAFTVTRHQIIKENIVSEEEVQLLQMQQKKTLLGYKNVDSILEKILFRGGRPKVCLLFAKNSITDTDFKKGMEAAASHIDFDGRSTTFTNISEFSETLVNIDRQQFDALAIIRGGGQGLDVFRNIELVKTIINLKTPLISAVGHPDEKPFISRIADKDTSTPSLLGAYFKDLVNRVIEDRTKSKAVLITEVQKQYQERINSQEAQNKALNEKVNEMTKAQGENTQKYSLAMKGLQNQIEEMTKAQTRATIENEQKNKTIDYQLQNLNKTNEELKNELKAKNQDGTKRAALVAQQEEQIKALQRELSQKKGCMPGCLGMVATIIGVIILILI